VKETHLQGAVIDLCRLYGVAWYHAYSSRRSVPGWPDLALCGARGFLLRELKSASGTLTPEQDEWGLMLRNAGVSWDVWRPDDLHSGRIQNELQAIRLTRRREHMSCRGSGSTTLFTHTPKS
jgi:hypothetical protein